MKVRKIKRWENVSPRLLILSVLFFGVLSAGLAAQTNILRFKQISIEEELSQSSVTCILQDRSGFMWFGTQDGLNRYDGYSFKVFRHDPRDDATISDNYIWCMYEDRSGMLWIGTNGGLNRYDPETDCFTRFQHAASDPESLGDNDVRAVFIDRSGRFWVGTNGGLNRFDPGTGHFTRYRHLDSNPYSLSHNQVRCIYEDRFGGVWIGTEGGGLNRFDPGSKQFTCYQHDDSNPYSLSHNDVQTICEDRSGVFWIGTRGGGLNSYNRRTGRFTCYQHDDSNPYSLSHNNVLAIYEDRSGVLWIGTVGGGLNTFNRKTGQFMRFQHDAANSHSLSHNDIWSICEDRSGLLWIGTWGGGLNKFDPQTLRFSHYKHAPNPKSLSHNDVWCFYEDSFGEVWVGTRNGLNKFDRKTGRFTHYYHDDPDPDSIGCNDIRTIYEDRFRVMWIGTGGGGLNIFNRKTGVSTCFKHREQDPHSLSHNDVRGILEDRDGELWIATNGGGLNTFDRKNRRFTRFMKEDRAPDSLGNNYVLCMYEDRSGVIWVGTDGGGLDKFERKNGHFTHYRHDAPRPHSLSNNFVMSIYEDRSGVLWIGTYGGGLNRFDRKLTHFRAFLEKDGLPNEVIYGILGDSQGNLWISTNKGLSCFNPAKETFKNYDAEDGMQNCEFNAGAYFQNRKGEMFFGGINGFNAFFPGQITDNLYQPPVVITDFLIFNRPVPLQRQKAGSPLKKSIHKSDALTLSYKDSLFSFEFAALHYANPKKNRYAYKLKGWDSDWIETDWKNRRATYTNLPGGNYVFQVKGTNKDGIWNQKGTSIKLEVLTAPWKTWWAYTLYFLVLAAIVYVLWYVWGQKKKMAYEHSLVKRLKEVDRLKDEFLSNTSHELRTPLNGIIGLTESLIDGAAGAINKKLAEDLSIVVSSARRLANLVNDILDFSRLKHRSLVLQKKAVDLRSLTDVVLNLSRPLVGKKKLEIVNAIEPGLPPVEADEERLQQIMYNLLGNAVKFTLSGLIKVSAEVKDDRLVVRVADTGIGIPGEKIEGIFGSFVQGEGSVARTYGGAGLGLAITKDLVELHGGKIWVESTAGKGSTFFFTLPLSGEKLVKPSSGPVQVFAAPKPELEWKDSPVQQDIPEAGDFHILVVDDDPVSRQVLINHLSMQNYTISEASSGDETLKAFEEDNDFDLILLDIMMPGMSGYEVCREIRKCCPAYELPIIFLTAKNQVNDLVTGFISGANDFITKPVSKSELLARVNTHLHLLEVTRNLEQKVEKRTHELKKKNDELQDAYKKVEEVSLSDPLTELRNRRYLQKFIQPDIAKVQRDYEDWLRDRKIPLPAMNNLVFLILDLDHFKRVNDTYGHRAGDRVLKQLGEILRRECRKADILVRWGGEEFLIVSRFTGWDQTRLLAERLRRSLENHRFDLGGGKMLKRTCSIGFASYPFLPDYPGVLNWEQVVDIADQALYAVKNSGRNGWVGVLGTEKTKPDNLFQRIRGNIKHLVVNGELAVQTSIPPGKELSWE
jgi:diguanylate cyclase (GGDEF)-like protein